MNIINKVAVYGTLKKAYANHSSMVSAGGEYIGKDYIQIERVDCCGFPMVKLSDSSKKWLEVEVYNVSLHWIEWPLDTLEWYTPWSTYNLYHRVKTITKNWAEVWVYEIERDVDDKSEDYFTHKEGEDLFFTWDRTLVY